MAIIGSLLVFIVLLSMIVMSMVMDWMEARSKCAFSYCKGIRDQRCNGGNCTAHCRDLCGSQCMPKPSERKLKIVK